MPRSDRIQTIVQVDSNPDVPLGYPIVWLLNINAVLGDIYRHIIPTHRPNFRREFRHCRQFLQFLTTIALSSLSGVTTGRFCSK